MRKRLLTVVVAAVLDLNSGWGMRAAQNPVATFRAETTILELDARVLDRQGHFVPGLTASDFDLYEDGELQPLVSAELVDLSPVTEAQRGSVLSDVSSNGRTATFGHYYLLVLDDLHTSVGRSQTMKDIARRFVETTVGPSDQAAIVVTSGSTGPSHDFTNRQQSLLDSINRFVGQKGVNVAAGHSQGSTLMDRPAPLQRSADTPPNPVPIPRPPSSDTPDEEEEGWLAYSMVGRLRNWVNALSGLAGQAKSVVFFSEGIGYDTFQPFKRWSLPIDDRLKETIAAATRNNVTLYAVDPVAFPPVRSPTSGSASPTTTTSQPSRPA